MIFVFYCNSGPHIYLSNSILFPLESHQLLKSFCFGFQSICFPSHYTLFQYSKSTFSVFSSEERLFLLLHIFTVCKTGLWYSGSEKILKGLSMRWPEGSYHKESSHLDGVKSKSAKVISRNQSEKGLRKTAAAAASIAIVKNQLLI